MGAYRNKGTIKRNLSNTERRVWRLTRDTRDRRRVSACACVENCRFKDVGVFVFRFRRWKSRMWSCDERNYFVFCGEIFWVFISVWKMLLLRGSLCTSPELYGICGCVCWFFVVSCGFMKIFEIDVNLIVLWWVLLLNFKYICWKISEMNDSLNFCHLSVWSKSSRIFRIFMERK